ncbi:MAG: NAD(P)-dependent oxidoreductase [Anaerolineae bacterium]
MTTLVLGATGVTGRLLVKQLLEQDVSVRVIVRSPDKLPEAIRNHSNLSIIHASVLDLGDNTLIQHVKGCDAVASCLGHTMNFQGIFGHPRRLVTDATNRICDAIKANNPDQPVKFVLMNTAGNSNRDLSEHISFAQRCMIWLIRLLLPPHADNEQAADYLRVEIGQDDPVIEWAVVRPDNLIDNDDVTEYEVHASPIRSAIFDPGTTSRVNVAHFMANLITDRSIWDNWKGQMPVIYNKTST